MAVTVGLFEKTYDRLFKRLEDLKLNIEIRTFDKDGFFKINGEKIPASKTELDYLWLSPDLAGGCYGNLPFEIALTCKYIDVLQTFNAGLDNSAYKEISRKGVRICKSNAQSVAIAEYVMAHALSLIHPIDQQRNHQNNKEWNRTPFREISNTNWLLIGFGPIGLEIAKRAKAFEAKIDVIRRSPQTSNIVDRTGTMANLREFLPTADVLVFACSLNNKTRKFADARFFQMVKKDAVLINIARGALIDDQAMIDALNRGQLGAAVLDVFDREPLPFDHPIWEHPKIRVTAHTSFSGNGTPARWDELFLTNLPRYVQGRSLLQEVDSADIG